METCFLCLQVMVPAAPHACKNAALQTALEAIQYARIRNQPINVADYNLRLFEKQKICLIEEKYDAAKPTVSLTNSIETAIVLVCLRYSLCPALWTFVEYANNGQEKHSYHEYGLIVLEGNDVEWKYLWHSDAKKETEAFSDALLIQRVEQYRGGANTLL